MHPPSMIGPTVPSPVLHLISAAWAILPSSLYVNFSPSASESANAVLSAPPALVPKPAPMGISISCLMVTFWGGLALLRSVSATVRVVSASGAGFLFMKSWIVVFSASVVSTRVWTPFSITKPPPLAPTWLNSVMGFPSGVVSQIWKKLEIPPGANAFAVFVGSYTSPTGGCFRRREGNAARHAFMTGGPTRRTKGISVAKVQMKIAGMSVA